MIQPALVLAVSFGYLLLLVAVAAHGDRRAGQGRSLIDNSLVYALSWAVYCSAWTYFGSVGRAASGGVWFLPIYLGPMLAMLLAWLVLRKMVRIARSYRITSIADFIASRYGKSPLLAALVTLITVVGILPYIALQLKAVSAGYEALTGGPGPADAAWWQDGTLYMALSLAGFAVVFGTRHLDLSERHEGMVAAIAFESAVKLAAFLAVGIFVTYGLFGGMGDIWARAQAQPDIAALLQLGGQGFQGFQGAQWFTLTLLSMLSVLLLPRQFQMMVVECVNERHILPASWQFPAYLLLINIFVLPIAIGGMLIFGDGGAGAESYVLTLPLSQGAEWLALLAYLGGLSAATGMIIVETVAVSTMVCNDLVMPALLGSGRFARTGGDLTQLLLNIRRAAILLVLLLGYLYFRVAGEAYALVSIGLISFAAVAQFAPALLGGMYWRGATRAGALGGLIGGSLVWAYTLMLPSVARSGWIPGGFLDGPFGLAFLAPQRLFGLTGFDELTHSLFWSLLVNIGLYVGLSLRGRASAREASQALLFVEVFQRGQAQPVFWRGRARPEDLRRLAGRFLGAARAEALFRDHARETGTALDSLTADARLVERVERQIAGAIGTASARVMVESVAQEEPLSLGDVLEIIDEASQVRTYARELEEATVELRAANEKLKSLDQLKDDFMSSVTHELRTPLTSIRALTELMLDTPDIQPAEREEFLGIILSESERLSRLVNQVLDLAKIESGMAEWHNTDVDMKALIAAALRSTAELFRERGAEVMLDLPEQVPMVLADPDRLTQVLVNLLSNAAKFVPEGRGRVEVALRHQGDELVVMVRDNGPGVAAADQAAVFDKFRQGGEAGNRPPGTGLGLPISRQIVVNLGGRMWLDSQPGQGACFAFSLPLSQQGRVG
ncbi:ATP-binding protein [Paracoccus sp. P2]|uniref:histidine kinase n=2 Tax=Paracoccus pantotrophus TaxID=82367 RepID=A0A1I5HNZ2_PARPN|nr:ATP-binding protein [Paracoccus pantotrophus]MDF3853767.1 ATP-binding protein [Paracoccus pantotrophus]QFG36533.1 histidine kinase [Paracoccus pantotrophus]QLH16804.1 histidine kinase [Paracoccus pantotrophus]RDD96176.1 histidine kinase [Paracoccus pantotrophus]RKS42873.1 Na+/proline symporter [Paracoccus pantotrophus]